jgi:homogentisate 1,2-dioxygenase
MLDRMQLGDVARKHHIQLRGPDGALRYEECITRDGFDGPYTILYHLRRPHTHRITKPQHGWMAPQASADRALAKRHYKTSELARSVLAPATPGAPQIDARVALLFNDDVIAGVAFPSADDPVYVADGDADQLIYVQRGGGVLRSLLGDVGFTQGDYVFVPRGLLHRFVLADAAGPQYWLWFSLTGGLHVPRQWRNEIATSSARRCGTRATKASAKSWCGARVSGTASVSRTRRSTSSAGTARSIRGHFRSSRSSRASARSTYRRPGMARSPPKAP